MRKVILYSAVSIDGFIAREDGNIDWLSSVDNLSNDDHGYSLFYPEIDVTLMGRKTFEQILSFSVQFPYPDKINYVFSRQKQQEQTNKYVQFVNDDVNEFIKRLKEESGKDIWLIGGGELNTTLLNAGLIDEMILIIIPIILGKGISLFGQKSIEQKFKHSDTKTFSTGSVQIKYTK